MMISNSRTVLELDVTAATIYVEKPELTPRQGGRWLVFPNGVWWETPDGAGYRQVNYAPQAFPGADFTSPE